jgi:multiple sugar transport system ATP-binding protein
VVGSSYESRPIAAYRFVLMAVARRRVDTSRHRQGAGALIEAKMASVTIQGVRKSFGETAVLHGVDIDIADGSFTVLVGPSGCGKSTLLRMIAGLEEISGGEIRIGARKVNDVPPKERDIAMVFQNYALYPHMTVRQNLAFSLVLAKKDKATVESKVARAAEILALSELMERYPRQLSGGQRQRVAMGRAIVRDPQVFLYDEPLSNLDAKLRVAMRSELKELHQRLKTTTVYVTHDQIEAMTMGDKIVVMKDGRIEQMGSPLDLYDHPANVFVAGFIGSPAMNFVPATLRRAGGVASLELADGSRLGAPANSGGIDGQPVVLGTRPEHLQLADSGGIASRVVVMEPTGADTFVACRHGSIELSAVFRERHDFTPGSTIHLVPDLQRAHLFDAGSGQRLAA